MVCTRKDYLMIYRDDTKNLISVVVSVYNEEEALESFWEEASRVLVTCPWDYELIFVNDGSLDGSKDILEKLAIANPKVKVINFSRNYGHEAAMLAGIDNASGNGIICMDADLQHPVSMINDIVEKFDEGYDVVNMVRTKNKSAGLLKNITSKMFYGVLNKFSDTKFESNASDFFAVSRKVVNVLRNEYRERVRFLRGYVQSVGFKKTTLSYEAGDRVAGKSKYSIKKLFSFSINAIVNFSDAPLKVAGFCGGLSVIAGLVLMIYTLISYFEGNTPDGYATIIMVMCFMFAMVFVLLGILGEYMRIVFKEVKGRPIYIVDEKINFKE